jgi:hypothetical protein
MLFCHGMSHLPGPCQHILVAKTEQQPSSNPTWLLAHILESLMDRTYSMHYAAASDENEQRPGTIYIGTPFSVIWIAHIKNTLTIPRAILVLQK